MTQCENKGEEKANLGQIVEHAGRAPFAALLRYSNTKYLYANASPFSRNPQPFFFFFCSTAQFQVKEILTNRHINKNKDATRHLAECRNSWGALCQFHRGWNLLFFCVTSHRAGLVRQSTSRDRKPELGRQILSLYYSFFSCSKKAFLCFFSVFGLLSFLKKHSQFFCN